MPFDAPFTLGPFTVDAEGRLSPSEPGSAPAFLFRWRDRLVRARVDRADNEIGRLTLYVTLARVCSTASTSDATLRPRSFALLHWLLQALPGGWQLSLLADHRVRLETSVSISLRITAAGLVTE